MNKLFASKKERIEIIEPYKIKDRKKNPISFRQFCNGTFIPNNSDLYIDSVLFHTTCLYKEKNKENFLTRGLVLGHKHIPELSFVFSDYVTNTEETPYVKTFIGSGGQFSTIWEYLEKIKNHFFYKYFTTYLKRKKFSFILQELEKIHLKINATEVTNNEFSKKNTSTFSEYDYQLEKQDFFKTSKYISIGYISAALNIQYELYKENVDFSMDDCFEMYKLYLKTIKKECIYDDELLSLVDFIKESRNNSNEIKDIKNMIEIEYSF